MKHASTIAMARTLLQRGRADDVLRMLDPLAGNAARDDGDVLIHALLARTCLLAQADTERAAHHLEQARAAEVAPSTAAIRDLWDGWLRAWPHPEHFRPATALAYLQRSHAGAASHDVVTRTWALIGGALVYVLLDQPLAAGHLLRQARATGWLRHDVDAAFWHAGLSGALAVMHSDHEAAESAIDKMAQLIGRLPSPLYRAALDIIRTRVAIESGASSDEVKARLDPILQSMDDDVRGPSLPALEARLLLADIQLRDGDADALQRLSDESGAHLALFPLMKRRLANRSASAELSDEDVDAASHAGASAAFPGGHWPDGSRVVVPYWGSLPPLPEAPLPMLLTGERGTGKKYLARQIHAEVRGDGPFVEFDCALATPAEFEPRLFGSSGDGVLREAEGGTVLIREIDAMPLGVQRKLARWIADSTADVTLIATSSTNGTRLAAGDVLATELYEAVACMMIHLPPLRERREQLPLLVADIVAKLQTPHQPVASITDDALDAITWYSWPGNIRQLHNELERMMTLVSSEPAPVIGRSDLPPEITGAPAAAAGDSSTMLDDVLNRAERSVIEKVLTWHAGHVSSAADELGLTRQGLYKKIRRLGIDTARFQTVGAASADA